MERTRERNDDRVAPEAQIMEPLAQDKTSYPVTYNWRRAANWPEGRYHMGAGVIPFCVNSGKVYFLFHRTFSGRRAGHLVDFGGGGREDESHRQTAMREFVEETETLYFSPDPKHAVPTEQRIQAQIRLLEKLFDSTLSEHPDWWCQRKSPDPTQPKDWKTFFVEVDYRDLADMNRQWQEDAGRRFKKRRELIWLAADELIGIYQQEPHRLWRRVRQLKQVKRTLRSIVKSKAG